MDLKLWDADSNSWVGVAGAGLTLTVHKQFDDAAIQANNSVPLAMGIAPGAGFAIFPLDYVFVIDTLLGSYITSGDRLFATYEGGDNAELGAIPDAAFTGTTLTNCVDIGAQLGDGNPPAQPVPENEDIVFSSASDYAGGNPANTFSVELTYKVVPVTPFS